MMGRTVQLREECILCAPGVCGWRVCEFGTRGGEGSPAWGEDTREMTQYDPS